MKQIIILGILVIGCAVFAEAQVRTPRITGQQLEQRGRIRQGVRSGELTRRETRQLQMQQNRIRREKCLAKADGVVTMRERAHLRQHQNLADRSIHFRKHNFRRRS